MIKAYEYRIYLTSQQEEIFNQTLGLCRLYWNIVVFNKNQNHNMQIEGYKLTFQKYKTEALGWVKESDLTSSSTAKEGKYYTVQRGDTLWGIAKKFYGNGSKYPEIAKANNISNPDIIHTGQVILIP